MIALATALGTTGCLGTGASEPALCRALGPPVAALSDALASHPETPAAVGEPATTAVITVQGGCR